MQSTKHPFGGIKAAIAELGNPERVWFRGHVREHHLLPSLFRFPEGAENEQRIFNRFNHQAYGVRAKPPCCRLEALLAMHYSYVPTRLLAWTESLRVALFCALVRESDQSTIFVLDPVALNAVSNVLGIVRLGSKVLEDFGLSSWPNELSLPDAPIAIDVRSRCGNFPETETVYTMHGRAKFPLEQQCAHCVRKVVLTEEERSLAMASVLNGD